jgi:hypothetical protein
VRPARTLSDTLGPELPRRAVWLSSDVFTPFGFRRVSATSRADAIPSFLPRRRLPRRP